MESRTIKIGLGIAGVAVISGLAFWATQPEPEPPREELELLAEEFIEIKCSRGTSAGQAQHAEERSKEIRERMQEIRDSKETSEEVEEINVQILQLISTDCTQLQAE